MLLLHCFYIRDVAKVQFMDNMTDIKCFYLIIDHQPGEDVLICMCTDMEVSGDFFDSERSNDPASIIVFKGSFCHIELFSLIRFSQ